MVSVRKSPRSQTGGDPGSDLPATAHAAIYAALKSALMNGDFQPGDRLVVRDLSERFSTSAMPVREALRKLVNDEALDDLPNRGVTVPAVRVEAVADLFRVRCAVEGAAAEWAASTISPAELDRVIETNEAMEACVRSRQVTDYLALNRTFHFMIYRAARSDVLTTMIERLWLRAGPLLNVMRQEATIQQGLDHHTEILDALRIGDGPRARRAIASDIGDAGSIIQRALPYWAPSTRRAAANTREAPE